MPFSFPVIFVTPGTRQLQPLAVFQLGQARNSIEHLAPFDWIVLVSLCWVSNTTWKLPQLTPGILLRQEALLAASTAPSPIQLAVAEERAVNHLDLRKPGDPNWVGSVESDWQNLITDKSSEAKLATILQQLLLDACKWCYKQGCGTLENYPLLVHVPRICITRWQELSSEQHGQRLAHTSRQAAQNVAPVLLVNCCSSDISLHLSWYQWL